MFIRNGCLGNVLKPRLYNIEVTNPVQYFSLNFWALFIFNTTITYYTKIKVK